MEGKSVCSERCLTLCRRAAFKRSKVCDWCKKSVAEATTAGELGEEIEGRKRKKTVDFATKEGKLQFCR